MISAIMYFIAGIVIGTFSCASYMTGYGKGIKNPFAILFFWSALFIALGCFKSAILIPIAILTENKDLLFWNDFIGRGLYYISAIFCVRVPIYKIFPKSKKTVIASYMVALIGIMLLIYQLIFRNTPILSNVGIINWKADIVMAVGIAILFILPWAAISYIFISEFIRSKFSSHKPLLLGLGFFLVCVGGIFQDMSTTVAAFVFFGIVFVTGFLLSLAGIFYDKENL